MSPRPTPPEGPDPLFVDRLVKGTMVAIVVLASILILGLIIIFLTWLASTVY